MPPKAVVTGGGSAGHVVPALPVIEALLAHGWEVGYIGSDSGLEERLVAPLGIGYDGVRTGKLRRYFSFANAVDAFRVPLGVLQAIAILRRRKPDVVFSKGGFVAFPAVAAAWLLRIPVVAHESDLSPGLANRLSLPFIKTLCVTFRATQSRAAPVVWTGTPVRRELTEGDADAGRRLTGFSKAKPLLVIVGGSLGARRLNEVADAARAALTETFNVFHVRGAGQLGPAASDDPATGYVQREFVGEGWGDVLAAADVVVSRAGANALYELLCLGKPHLLVPLPATASRGDQIENAAHTQRSGYSLVIQDADLDAAGLVAAARALNRDRDVWRDALAGFRPPDSVALIVAELMAAAGQAAPGAPPDPPSAP